MYNDLLTIGPVTLRGYGLMIGIGILVAIFLFEIRGKKFGYTSAQLEAISIYTIIGGFIGAKILFYVVNFKMVIKNPDFILQTLGDGFVVYGGIAGGILTGVIYCKIKKLDKLQILDLALPAVAIAQGFGRIGCFLAGCCYGEPTNCPISITFVNSAFAPNHIPLIPTQLYSSTFDFANGIFLLIVEKFAKRKGLVSGLYMIIYGTGRFIIEFYRGDLERGFFLGLSTSQILSVFVIICGIILISRGLLKNE